jgi:hypothetical protein
MTDKVGHGEFIERKVPDVSHRSDILQRTGISNSTIQMIAEVVTA